VLGLRPKRLLDGRAPAAGNPQAGDVGREPGGPAGARADGRAMRVIIARASARYTGRIEAQLGLGDICIMHRDPQLGGDGSVLLHDLTRGLNPRNWMPGGTVCEPQPWGYVFTHRSGERLEVYVETVFSDSEHRAELRGELVKTGAEREFSNLIAENLHRLGDSLALVQREFRTPAGPMDLLCLDDSDEQRPVCVEVKRARVCLADCYQAHRYLHALDAMSDWSDAPAARALLVGPVLAKNAKALIDAHDRLAFVRLGYADLRAA
jgi:endonuclease